MSNIRSIHIAHNPLPSNVPPTYIPPPPPPIFPANDLPKMLDKPAPDRGPVGPEDKAVSLWIAGQEVPGWLSVAFLSATGLTVFYWVYIATSWLIS